MRRWPLSYRRILLLLRVTNDQHSHKAVFDGFFRPLSRRQYKRTNEASAITLVKHTVTKACISFCPHTSRPSRTSLQCPPRPIATAHHSAIAMPRQGERRSWNLSLLITARFNAMMNAKLVYAEICAARIKTKGSWVIQHPGNSAYRSLKLLPPSKNIRELLRGLFRAFRTSFAASALFGYYEAGAPSYGVRLQRFSSWVALYSS